MSTRTKILRTLVVLGVLASIVAAGVYSAFSSQTDNPGNEITAGTVELEDNDGGVALYDISNAKPGASQESCIEVTYEGSLDATVKLYTPSSLGTLAPYVNLKIEAGSGGGAFPSCSGFSAGSTLYNDTLAKFSSEHGDYESGVTTNPPSASKWVTDDSVVYRVTATLSASTPDEFQDATTGSHLLRWEAQNQ